MKSVVIASIFLVFIASCSSKQKKELLSCQLEWPSTPEVSQDGNTESKSLTIHVKDQSVFLLFASIDFRQEKENVDDSIILDFTKPYTKNGADFKKIDIPGLERPGYSADFTSGKTRKRIRICFYGGVLYVISASSNDHTSLDDSSVTNFLDSLKFK